MLKVVIRAIASRHRCVHTSTPLRTGSVPAGAGPKDRMPIRGTLARACPQASESVMTTSKTAEIETDVLAKNGACRIASTGLMTLIESLLCMRRQRNETTGRFRFLLADRAGASIPTTTAGQYAVTHERQEMPKAGIRFACPAGASARCEPSPSPSNPDEPGEPGIDFADAANHSDSFCGLTHQARHGFGAEGRSALIHIDFFSAVTWSHPLVFGRESVHLGQPEDGPKRLSGHRLRGVSPRTHFYC